MSTSPDTPSDAGPAEVHAHLVAITSALVAMIRQHETAWAAIRPHGNARAAVATREAQL